MCVLRSMEQCSLAYSLVYTVTGRLTRTSLLLHLLLRLLVFYTIDKLRFLNHVMLLVSKRGHHGLLLLHLLILSRRVALTQWVLFLIMSNLSVGIWYKELLARGLQHLLITIGSYSATILEDLLTSGPSILLEHALIHLVLHLDVVFTCPCVTLLIDSIGLGSA